MVGVKAESDMSQFSSNELNIILASHFYKITMQKCWAHLKFCLDT